jgi:hypothetical protein
VAKVLKTDRADHLVVDVPTDFDIGKPYAGATRTYSSYRSLVSYQDPATNSPKTAYLPTLQEFRPQQELPVLVSQSGDRILHDTLLGVWGSFFLFLLSAVLCGILGACLRDIKSV